MNEGSLQEMMQEVRGSAPMIAQEEAREERAVAMATASASSDGGGAFSLAGLDALKAPKHDELLSALESKEVKDEDSDSDEEGDPLKAEEGRPAKPVPSAWFDRDAAVAQALSAHELWATKTLKDLQTLLQTISSAKQDSLPVKDHVRNELLLLSNREYAVKLVLGDLRKGAGTAESTKDASSCDENSKGQAHVFWVKWYFSWLL